MIQNGPQKTVMLILKLFQKQIASVLGGKKSDTVQ